MKPIKVFLADLRHNYSGVLASDCMPLGIAYMKAVMDRDLGTAVESRLFVYPQRLLQALREQRPDVLMMTNYAWNEGLLRHFLRVGRSINPRMLLVAGGPNLPIEAERQMDYVRAIGELDLYVKGEGDIRASEIVTAFENTGRDREVLLSAPLNSCLTKSVNGQIYNVETSPRHRSLEEIPSPWLSGIQDEFFDGKLAPMIETNRGCPFTCTFCVQGTSYYTKVNHFPVDRIKEELRYIAKRIQALSPAMGVLRIADSNYGMFERDLEISEFIGELQRDFGWPTYIDATTGKNRADRIIKSVEKVGGALVLYQAVQSLDEQVLRNVRRQNIKLSVYKEIGIYMRGRGLKSVSDLILGLPGESLETHVKALRELIDSNVEQLHNMQAMVLKGSELETAEARTLFKFETRFRLVPKAFGEYGKERVFDTEEIVVSTDTFSFEDYLQARRLHLASSIFWNNGWFHALLHLAGGCGVSNSEWWLRMLKGLEHGSDVAQQFLADFTADTIAQLFPTRAACEAYYGEDAHFEALRHGNVGDNLMYRYRALASFCIWDEIASVAIGATLQLLREKGVHSLIDDLEEFFQDLSLFVRLSHATGQDEKSLFGSEIVMMRYDVARWLESEFVLKPHLFKSDHPKSYRFRLTERGEQDLRAALMVWTTSLHGLSKLVTRVDTSSQQRVCEVLD